MYPRCADCGWGHHEDFDKTRIDVFRKTLTLQRMFPGIHGPPQPTMKIISGPLQINAIGKQAVGKQLIRRAVNLPDRKKNRLTTSDILLLMTQVGPYNTYDYPFNLEPIGENGEGGYLISFPDLPFCIAIGKDPGDAVEKGM